MRNCLIPTRKAFVRWNFCKRSSETLEVPSTKVWRPFLGNYYINQTPNGENKEMESQKGAIAKIMVPNLPASKNHTLALRDMLRNNTHERLQIYII